MKKDQIVAAVPSVVASSLRRFGVGVIVDSRKGFTQTLFAFEGPTFRLLWQAFSRVTTKKRAALKYKLV